jgi:hypothetical protein
LQAGDIYTDPELDWRCHPVPNTQSKEVNLTKRVQTSKEGAYYLEWREKGRRVRLSVGKDAQDAAARGQRKEAELNALNNGVSVLPGMTFRLAIDDDEIGLKECGIAPLRSPRMAGF